MTDWHSLGPHRFRYEDDVLYFEPQGVIEPEYASVWMETIGAHFQRNRTGFLIVDARKLMPPSHQVRRLFLTWLKQVPVRPRVVGFGVNLMVRAASRLVLAAARQLYGFELDLTVVATEADAWAHIEQQRRKLQASSAHP